MYWWLTSRVSPGALLLALCLLTPAVLWAAPIGMASPDAGPFAADFSAPLSPASLCSLCDIPYTAAAVNPSVEYTSPSPMDLAAVTAAEPGPNASTLLVIGAAMIWIAGVIRYSPVFQD